jgi:hypothetical protein
MTPQQALELLDRVLQNVNGTRRDHELIQQALNVLREILPPPPGPY